MCGRTEVQPCSNIRQRNCEENSKGRWPAWLHALPTLTFVLFEALWLADQHTSFTKTILLLFPCHPTLSFTATERPGDELRETLLRLIKLILHLLSSMWVWWFSFPLNKGHLLMAIFCLVQKMFCAMSKINQLFWVTLFWTLIQSFEDQTLWV